MIRTEYSFSFAACAMLFSCCVSALAGPVVAFVDGSGAAGRAQAPVCASVTLDGALLDAAQEGRIQLREVGADLGASPVLAQFESEAPGNGKLWWLMPEGASGERRFELTETAKPSAADMQILMEKGQRYTFLERGTPVLTYNFGTVQVPDGVSGIYAVARSDYVHPIYGPGGAVLTQDFSPDHPHHRGLYWAWPEVKYGEEIQDLHALQGVFARPVKMLRNSGGTVFARLEAENVWKWKDSEPIVQETAQIRVYHSASETRVIDFCFQFEALKEGVSLARRDTDKYGGLNMRLSQRTEQEIVMHTDAPEARPRRSWAELSGTPAGAQGVVGVTILESTDNPDYPGEWVKYDALNWLQPTFPRTGTRYALSPGTPLVLKYRIIIHPGLSDEGQLADLWETYNALDTDE